MNIKRKIETLEFQLNYAKEMIVHVSKDLQDLKDNTPEKNVRFKVEEDGGYWYLDDYGDVSFDSDITTYKDYFRYNIGNYFETEKEVETHKEKLLITQELKDLAMELNTEPIDWHNYGQSKYFIEYIYKATVGGYLSKQSIANAQNMGVVYCINETFLAEALKRIGEGRLLKLYI